MRRSHPSLNRPTLEHRRMFHGPTVRRYISRGGDMIVERNITGLAFSWNCNFRYYERKA